MRAISGSDRGRWGIAALVSVLLGLSFTFMFRAPLAEPLVPRFGGKPSVGIGLRRVAPAEAALVDPTPLFLPTVWNAAQKDVALPKAGGAFANYPAKFVYDESEFRALRSRSMAVTGASDVLGLTPPGASLLGIGRQSRQVEVLPLRGAYIEVSRHAGGLVVLNAAVPTLPFQNLGLWDPVEFLAVVDRSGLCGPLVSTVRSKADEIDAYFKNYLTNTIRLGAKLEPGFYRIRVGP